MFNEARRAAWVEISLGNIRDNFRSLREHARGSEVIACVKADAYGHGIVKTAWELVKANTDYLGVATIDEAIAIRAAGIRAKIVLLSPVPRGNFRDALDLRLIPVITSLTDAGLLSEAAARFGGKERIPFFISLETGMGRLGFLPTAGAIADIIKIASLPGIELLGVFSHFATADEPDLTFSKKQLAAFNAFADRIYESGFVIKKRSIANSAGLIALPESRLDIVRPGVSLYGLYPSETMLNSYSKGENAIQLNPAMSVKANIVYIKNVPPGFPVSYGSRFVTTRDSLIASLPIGYGDGLSRNMTGKARVLVRGRYAPIIGTICMDQCMADVTDIPGVGEYGEVVIMGEQEGNTIPAEEIAANSGTNVYEAVCRFGQRLPRRYI